MTRRVLVPTDGSELADRVLDAAPGILRDAEVHLACAVASPGREPEVTLARRHLEALAKRIGGAKPHVVVGEPATKIAELARELSPVLIALSTHGRSGVARWVRGSVAERVLAVATEPVLLVPPRAELVAGEVLVALDGSDESATILPVASEVAQALGAKLVLAHVLDLPVALQLAEPLAVLAAEDQQADARGEAERFLAHQAKKLPGKVETLILWGSPANAILEAAEQRGSSLIAMTTHGRSGPSRWLYGSVAELVLHHARTALLVRRTSGP